MGEGRIVSMTLPSFVISNAFWKVQVERKHYWALAIAAVQPCKSLRTMPTLQIWKRRSSQEAFLIIFSIGIRVRGHRKF